VDAADAARGEDAEPGAARYPERPGDGRRAVLAARDRERQVAPADLAHALALGEPRELRRVEPDAQAPAEHGHGRRHSPALAHGLLQTPRRLEVLRARQPVRDDSRFERHDRAPLAHGGLDLFAHLDKFVVRHLIGRQL
jgi:hypothetical protein